MEMFSGESFSSADLHDPALLPGDVPIGRPLPGTRAAVLDGELYLLGDALARGYRVETPDDTRFGPLAALPGSPRAYRTGDLVRLGEDGQLRTASPWTNGPGPASPPSPPISPARTSA
ncbi:hypothetical protein [Streptomyces sp. NPDC056660]|uniref:hypothetical protein n=1 Tax=Streptomyces sp. NPDC056660 TaxID=3345897 RepID=UPI0036B20B7D